MTTNQYLKKYRELHRVVGLCRHCTRLVADGSVNCQYHLRYDRKRKRQPDPLRPIFAALRKLLS